MLVSASIHLRHILRLCFFFAREEEVRVRQKEKTPHVSFSLCQRKGNGGWGLRPAREVHHPHAPVLSGVSCVMHT